MHHHLIVTALAIIGFILLWHVKSIKKEFIVEKAYMVYYVGISIISLVAILWPITLTFSFFAMSHFIITGFAAVVSLFFTFIQLFGREELCKSCLASTLIIIGIFLFMAFGMESAMM